MEVVQIFQLTVTVYMLRHSGIFWRASLSVCDRHYTGSVPACFRAAHRHALQGKPDTLMDKAAVFSSFSFFLSFSSPKVGDGD